MNEWKTIGTETVFSSPWVRLKRNHFILPTGQEIPDYYTLETASAAAIVAIDPEGNIILKEEYRCAAGQKLIEIPAGMIEADESDALESAKRELREETGYTSSKWTYLGSTFGDPTRMTAQIHLYLAQDCQKTNEQSLDPNEVIRVRKMPLQDAVDMVVRNEIRAADSAYAILLCAQILKR